MIMNNKWQRAYRKGTAHALITRVQAWQNLVTRDVATVAGFSVKAPFTEDMSLLIQLAAEKGNT